MVGSINNLSLKKVRDIIFYFNDCFHEDNSTQIKLDY